MSNMMNVPPIYKTTHTILQIIYKQIDVNNAMRNKSAYTGVVLSDLDMGGNFHI